MVAAAATQTGIPVVPGPITPSGQTLTPLQQLANLTGGFIRTVAERTAEAIKPANIFVPGGAAAAKASVQAAEAVGKAGTAAAEGIKSGFSKATLILTLLGVFLVYRLIKG